jgi:hypothetical protein
MRECREDVLLGMIRFWSVWSRVPGRPSRSPVRGRTKEEWLLSDGPMMMVPDGLMLMIEYGAQNRISSRSIQYLGIYLILIEGYRSPAHGQLAYQWQARDVVWKECR